MSLLLYFDKFSWIEWLIFSLFTNIFLYLFSIGLYKVIDRICHKSKIQKNDHPVTKDDFFLSFLTVFLNTVIMLLGVYCWKMGWIALYQNSTLLLVIFETLAIVLIMDLLMYAFHYAAHISFVYKILHRKHHEHTSTNYLSLFVLHPFETLGFGLMMIVVFMLWDFSFYSIVIYLFVNLIWGTVGHLNREFFPKWTEHFFVGTTNFHHNHHLDESKNFGFYTSIWDRLFKTFQKTE